MHVIYHSGCYDGWGAAWVTLKRYPSATLVPLSYGSKLPQIPDGEDVYMVDISLPRQQMEELAQRVNLRVLDHHKTAQAALDGFPNTVFDMNRSGAMLAWDEFFPNLRAPKLISYVQDQDLWTWKLPEAKAVTAYIRSYRRTVADWNFISEVLDFDFGSAREQGHAILRSESIRVDEMCEHYRLITLGGHVVPAVNASLLFSDVCNRLCEAHPEYPFAAYYLDRSDNLRQWGLRSTGFDVSEIAKLYGGGGHRQASGFQTTIDFFPAVSNAVSVSTQVSV